MLEQSAADPASRPLFECTVFGTPAPQGSKSPKGLRRTKKGNLVSNLVESSKLVGPWRDAVKAAAIRTRLALPTWRTLDGPLVAEMHFTLPRPKSAPASRTRPDRYPDLSKLVRSTEDALTSAQIWRDDARVVEYEALAKHYVGSKDPRALARPGVIIRIWSPRDPHHQPACRDASAASH
ncbi:RusA family crossover junction endodeoxyribonuclease [Streptomyces sp. NRRL S-350]|uniref:RusA family crossover junction endodeoxyribonuclease n=1 Tax=Streptomyces sp. NRRL S-350 TaxID=1463902 RepID=UPI00099B4413|nr:RusA family crossover junction endodeoxyribonuclease [Streptomyces sp. NRRL S-350]